MLPITLAGLPAGLSRPGTLPAAAQAAAPTDPELGFGAFLQQALNQVEQAQREAVRQGQQLAMGQVQDIAQVMIAAEKATLSLQLTIAVRNKVLEAYQEIMRMPI